MNADVTMTVTFDRQEHAICEFVDDLLGQGYTIQQVYAALGVAVGATGAFRDKHFLIGLAGGASYLGEQKKSCKRRRGGAR